MPRAAKPLTDLQVRKDKTRQLGTSSLGGEGLYLFVMPNGVRWWRLKYRFAEKKKSIGLGS